MGFPSGGAGQDAYNSSWERPMILVISFLFTEKSSPFTDDEDYSFSLGFDPSRESTSLVILEEAVPLSGTRLHRGSIQKVPLRRETKK